MQGSELKLLIPFNYHLTIIDGNVYTVCDFPMSFTA